jgi:cytochrome c556
MSGKTAFGIAATLALSAWCGAAFAHSGATGIVAERMDAMKDIAAQMKQIGGMIKGERAYDAELAATAANAVSEHAGNMPALFPQGTNAAPSEALPDIWTEWEAFEQSAEDLRTSAAGLAEAALQAANANEIRPHFATVGKACAACHQDFRQAD